MGSSLSPSIADLVIDVLFDCVVGKLMFKLPFFKKYVDNLMITAIPHNMVEHTLDVFNSYNGKIQFTIEIEDNGTIPFLDMKLLRNPVDGSINTEWYMKPILSGRFLNFYSYQNINQKINTASGFINRVLTLTSNVNNNTFNTIRTLLKRNNYPTSLVSRLINKSHTKHNRVTN